MIQSGIDNTQTSQKWQELWSFLGDGASPFFSPEYYRVGQFIENVRVECFWAYQDVSNFLFYPYLVKNVNALGYDLDDQYFDVSGAYGYNGPLGVVEDRKFLGEYNSRLAEHLRQKNVITEFVRYCPITNNRRFHSYTDQLDVLDNVYIDLSAGVDRIWQDSFEYRVRKTIRKGASYSLQTHILRGDEIKRSDLESFYQIYTSTMQRNDADSFYFFDLDYFLSMHENMGQMLMLALTYMEGKAITTELVLTGGKLAFAFLGGTLGEYYQYKANTFQRWELLKKLCEHGFDIYSMGASIAREDSIYKFKKSFARDCVNPFYIGIKVHLPFVYKQVCDQWKERYPEAAAAHANKLQGYRIQA